MKILLTDNDTFFEYDAKLFVFKSTGEFAAELVKLGHSVEMLQTKIAAQSEFHTFDVAANGLKHTARRRYKSKVFTYLMVYIIGTWRLLHNDMVYVYFPSNYKYLGLIAKLFGKKFGLNVRGEKGVESRFSKFLYRHADVVFTVSPRFTQIVNQSRGRGITQRPAIAFTSNDIIYDRTYEEKSHYNLLFLGRIDRDKGIFELLEAIARLKSELGNEKFTLHVVGDGYELPEMKQRAKELAIDDTTEFYGAVLDQEKIREFYRISDIFILPTYHEGFPRTLYEAMLFGTPIITTFVGAIPALMIDGKNCHRIEPRSVDSICEKVKYVISNYPKSAQITKNCRDLAKELFDPQRPTHAQHLDTVIKATIK